MRSLGTSSFLFRLNRMMFAVIVPSGFMNARNLLHRTVAALALVIAIGPPLFAGTQNAVYKIPPLKIPLDVKGQPISITASGGHHHFLQPKFEDFKAISVIV